MFYKSLTLGLLSISLSACFLPADAPYDYAIWIKPRTSPVQIKKSMLECGYLEPWGINEPSAKMKINDEVMARRCMEQAGYTQISTPIVFSDVCLRNDKPHPPACAPDAIIPKPSVEKRLKSTYCRTQYRRFYSQKPPECL
ncbi:hypothetical protein [Bartonella sp. DGB2]|uniref:hypothetical protein n=1 Tax=Bartonella sp. DGB2 TaxID=3388426 RepID=UPI0039900224